MKLKFQLRLVLLLTLALALTSCASQFNDGGVINYRVGYDGVDIIVSGLPTYPIKVNDIFLVQVDLKNNGAYNIDDGYVSVFLEPENYFSVLEGDKDVQFATPSETLEGRGEFHPLGGQIPVPFVYKFQAGNISASQEQEFTFRARACYGYETIVETLACVGPRNTNFEDPEPYSCDINDEQDLFLERGQGAPVAVTSLTEDIAPGTGNTIRPRFRFTVENMGLGVPFSSSNTAEEVCTKTNLAKPNKIDFELQLSADYKYDSEKKELGDFDCGSSDFYLGEGILDVECTLKEEIPVSLAYYAPLVIKIKYNYAYSGYDTVTIRSQSYRR